MSWSKSNAPIDKPIFDTQPLPNNPPPTWDAEPFDPDMLAKRNQATKEQKEYDAKNCPECNTPFPIDTNIPLPVEPNPEPFFQPNSQVEERKDAATATEPIEPTIEELAAQWNHASTEQKKWRKAELKLRQQIVGKAFSEAEAGTSYASLPEGWRIKCVKGLDYKLDPDKTDAALNNFDDSLAALLVKWEPKLSVSNYKVLNEESKAFFNDALTIKPGLPTIELVPPATLKG